MNMFDDVKNEGIKSLDRAVKNLAQHRAMIIKTNVMTEEEVTDFINEAGTKWASKYEKMDVLEILLDAMAELIAMKGDE